MKIKISLSKEQTKQQVLQAARKRLGQMVFKLKELGKAYMHYSKVPEKWMQQKLHAKIEAFMAHKKQKKTEIEAQRKKIRAQQVKIAHLSAPSKKI